MLPQQRRAGMAILGRACGLQNQPNVNYRAVSVPSCAVTYRAAPDPEIAHSSAVAPGGHVHVRGGGDGAPLPRQRRNLRR